MSMAPAITIIPAASCTVSAAALWSGAATMRPSRIHTSPMPSRPLAGSMTRPPLMRVSMADVRKRGCDARKRLCDRNRAARLGRGAIDERVGGGAMLDRVVSDARPSDRDANAGNVAPALGGRREGDRRNAPVGEGGSVGRDPQDA